MFGYASNKTPELMLATLIYSHKILQRMAELRHSGARPEFEPDAKSQISLRYVDGKPVGATSVVVSTQHTEGLSADDDWRTPPADHLTTRYETKQLGDCPPVWFELTCRA